ncbi:MAG: alpha/beta hydrolase [Desulfobacteraceae bacterium]|nr:alpha/beta hydrolase [Desulfobacteraceae bacterium]
MIFNPEFTYYPSDKFYKIREKIIRWKKFISYYEDDTYKITEVRKNALKAAKSIKNNIQGETFKLSDSTLEWVRQCSTDSNINILYIHGGGFIAGSLDNHRPFAKILSRELNANILMIDYPLAPENKYPVQLVNTIEAFRYMKDISSENTFNGIIGDSAGGNIGLSALLSIANDNLNYRPDFGIFLSGFFDLSLSSASIDYNKKNDFVLKPDFLEFCADSYAGYTKDMVNPLISPVYGDFSLSCDLFFQVGSSEILLDDSVRCHKIALKNNVNSYISIWPEMMHSFQSYYPHFPESVFSVKEIGYFIRKCISKPG